MPIHTRAALLAATCAVALLGNLAVADGVQSRNLDFDKSPYAKTLVVGAKALQ